jgi:hypothetical protein
MFRVLFLVGFLLSCSITDAQKKEDEVFAALQSGNIAQLDKMSNSFLEVIIENDGPFKNKAESLSALDNFLKRVKVKSCRELHQGNSRTNTNRYTIGQMLTQEGEFRVFLAFRNAGAGSYLLEIRIVRA